jgi:DNA uptake protein ComE-like DNA-binding protein
MKPGSVSRAVCKLELCARLLQDEKLLKWCKFHLGWYTDKLPPQEETVTQKDADEAVNAVAKIGISLSTQEILHRLGQFGGGFQSIEFVEETLARLDREKRGNDNTHYRSNLLRVIGVCANAAYQHASHLHAAFSFGNIPRRQFDVIRERVDDLLLDVCPEAIEKFMAAYERLGSKSTEDWSHALTAARRVIKAVADALYPPQDTPKGARKLGEEQYINRLWAFLDEHVPAGSDKDLAKAHIDYLGSFLQRLNEKASKGVHAQVFYEEAVRAVLYTYLALGDVLEFASAGVTSALKEKGKIDIDTASIDELASTEGMSAGLAKQIVKARVKSPFKSVDELTALKGVGPKTLDKIRMACIAVIPIAHPQLHETET